MNESENYMPLAINRANKIVKRANELRENGEINYFKQDCKNQVTLVYNVMVKLEELTVLFFIQHSENVSLEKVRKNS